MGKHQASYGKYNTQWTRESIIAEMNRLTRELHEGEMVTWGELRKYYGHGFPILETDIKTYFGDLSNLGESLNLDVKVQKMAELYNKITGQDRQLALDTVVEELRKVAITANGIVYMPTKPYLKERGLKLLWDSVDYLGEKEVMDHGGFQPMGNYWTNETILERVTKLIKKLHPGRMVTKEEIRREDGELSRFLATTQASLLDIAELLKVSVKLPMPGQKLDQLQYPDSAEWVIAELKKIAKVKGDITYLPTLSELRDMGYYRLAWGIQFYTVEKILAWGGFSHRTTQWTKKIAMDKIQELIEKLHPGTMVTRQELIENGCGIIARGGIESLGSLAEIAESLGLPKLDKTETRGRKKGIEIKATRLKLGALQSLFDAGLITPMQEVIIKRHMGLLDEEKTLRLVRQRRATSSSPKPMTGKIKADEALEETVLKGLAGIGVHIADPTDDLYRTTVELLWRAFYRRLYAWYDTLDITHFTDKATYETILETYKEHINNEFVQTASNMFIQEVNRAVTFSSELVQPDSGWFGPRLMLHQAHAAIKMSDVLSSSSEHRFICNADEPGLGKSASFLAAVCQANLKKILIIAPLDVANGAWNEHNGKLGEIKTRLPQAQIVRGIDDALRIKPTAETVFYVLHYDELLNGTKIAELCKQSFDVICLDEAHRIKQRSSQNETQRRKAVIGLRKCAPVAVGMTGTPLINELREPLSIMEVLSGDTEKFDLGRLSSNRKNDRLNVYLSISRHTIRRRKSEVLLKLPKLNIETPTIIPLGEVLSRQTIEVCRDGSRHMGKEAGLRKIAIEAKLDYIANRVKEENKLVIFTYNVKGVSDRVFNVLDSKFPDGQIAYIDGDTEKPERQKILEAFRNDERVRAIVVTIRTMSEGVTMFDPESEIIPHKMLFADLPYTYGEFEQATSRLHRLGQRNQVDIEILIVGSDDVLEDGSKLETIDQTIWNLIETKAKLSNAVINGEIESGDRERTRKAIKLMIERTGKPVHQNEVTRTA